MEKKTANIRAISDLMRFTSVIPHQKTFSNMTSIDLGRDSDFSCSHSFQLLSLLRILAFQALGCELHKMFMIHPMVDSAIGSSTKRTIRREVVGASCNVSII